jgi:hypothetical protein
MSNVQVRLVLVLLLLTLLTVMASAQENQLFQGCVPVKKSQKCSKPIVKYKTKVVEVVKEVQVVKEAPKNTIFVDGRRDILGTSTKTEQLSNGMKASTTVNKGVVLGLNYYRRSVFNTKVGVGVGFDTNGVLRGMAGLDF